MNEADPTRRPVRRTIVVVLLGAAVTAGLLAGRGRTPAVPPAPEPAAAAATAPAGSISGSWFCPGWPSTFSLAGQTITLANLGASPSDAVLTVQPDNGSRPVSRTATVPAHSVRVLDRSTFAVAEPSTRPRRAARGARPSSGALPAGAVSVEPFSADVVVSTQIQSGDLFDSLACATSARSDWYFAGGTTVRGVSEWLLLQNPFSADARIDVTVWTDSGVLVVPSLEGLDVPGRSRVVVPIDQSAVRQARVALQVHASVGKVVASESLQYGAASGPPGLASTLGAPSQASAWVFAGGETRPDAAEWVAVADPGQLDAHVSVQGMVSANSVVAPVVIGVPSGGVAWVQIGGCGRKSGSCLAVPDRTHFSVKVQADSGVPIIAQELSRFGTASRPAGALTSVGSVAPSRRWIFPRMLASGGQSTSLSLLNDTASAAHVSVAFVHDGVVERPSELDGLTVASGQLTVLSNSGLHIGSSDAAAVVTSNVPLFSASTIFTARDAAGGPGIVGE